MAGVNTAGTYKLEDPVLTIDVNGTPYELPIAATSLGIDVENNFASHPRTGAAAPYEEYIDSVYTARLDYTHGFGSDGIFDVFEALKGSEVDWLIETSDGVVSAAYPTFAFTAKVPGLAPLPPTDMGEFATGSIEIPIKGTPVKATA